MSKKVSKKAAAKKGAALPDGWDDKLYAIVHPYLAGGFAEPSASQHARAVVREFKRAIEETT